eukprot:scaffold1.g5757.t1
MPLRVLWRDAEAAVPLPPDLATLGCAVASCFPALEGQDWVLSDTARDLVSDEDVASLRDGATLVVALAHDRALAAPARERITFVPHPLTVTAAGDYEYFAAQPPPKSTADAGTLQGRHPFVYALAEFIDNSLRATRANAPRPRAITVSLVVSGSNPATARGLVAVHDNGCGMTKQELNAWAVMNYSMEERGKAPQEPEAAGRHAAATGAGRFLTGDISFFGVGSKNASFLMGGSVKVTTKRADELYVHELCLRAEELEQRYRDQQDVYVEDMVHRNPGDASTLAPHEQPFAATRAWVAGEADVSSAGGSFTRVVVGDLKPDVLRQIMDDEKGAVICQELAHLYHYYLHGEQGNRDGGGAAAAAREGRLPNGEAFPDIAVQLCVDTRVVWSKRLAEVDDDMETKLLRAQRAELPFTLQVPDRGVVAGVLYYFPYENDHETVPTDASPYFRAREDSPAGMAGRAGGPTQRSGTQAPPATQAGPHATQAVRGGQQGLEGVAEDEEMDEEGALGWQTHPIFEAFWQGRLIPGARIDTLPFIEAVRQKRNAQAKDTIPDEAFRRLRGALFFGPAFKVWVWVVGVTRNKLLFRDPLQQLLDAAVPAERQMEAKLRQWLSRCHTTLDKSVRFERLTDARAQAAVRAKLGEGTTAFERISDGQRQINAGDVVRVNAKPLVVGRVLHFTIPQAVKEEGCYANGRLHVELLPPELHGAGCEKAFSMRRLEAVLTEAEVEEYVATQLKKVASTLRLEPMRFAAGQAQELAAAESILETTATVLNGAGQRMTKAALGGERIVVVQRLWRLPAEAAAPVEEAAPPPAKRQRKGRKGSRGKTQRDENAEPEGTGDGGDAKLTGQGIEFSRAELVVEFANKTPDGECFKFRRLGGEHLQRAGRYAVEYVASPAPAGQEPLRTVVELLVRPAAPAALELQGEGKLESALRPISLGEALPPVNVLLRDAFGNAVPLQPTLTPPSLSLYAAVSGPDGSMQQCTELVVSARQDVTQDGLVLSQVQVLGSDEAAQGATGPQLFRSGDGCSHPTARQAQVRLSQAALPVADVHLCIGLEDGGSELQAQTLPLQLRPGAPQSLRLLPDHPWGDGALGGSAAVSLAHKQALPDFSVQAFDAWGCPTGPSEHLPFQLRAECASLAPASREFEFGRTGVATVSGLVGTAATREGAPAALKLSLVAAPATPGAEAAFAAAGALEPLTLQVAVESSAEPVALAILKDGTPLLVDAEVGKEDGKRVALLELVPAGEQVTGLELVLLDASGALARQVTPGKVSVSWRSGCPKRTWEGQALKLPTKLAAPELVDTRREEWVRFTPDAGPPLEICLAITSKPGRPDCWSLALVEQATSQSPDELGVVQCGQPFLLELQMQDHHGNRCGGGGGDSPLPRPVIAVEGEGPLQYNEVEWEQGWVSQGGDQVYAVRMTLSGHPGQVKITASSVPGEALQLRPDSLGLELRAGTPAALCIDGLASLDCGTKVVIPQLRLHVVDAAGNPTTCSDSFDVSINSSALASDGSGRSAAVSVNGGNKTKMKKGAAVFKDVRSASRKVSLQDAVLHLVMAPQNTVTDLQVVVPEALAEGLAAGNASELHVALATENGVPLPADVVTSSLVLRVAAPGSSRGDAVVYTLPATSDEDSLLTDEGFYAFTLAEQTVAGTYNAVAEYTERRPELAAGLSKKEALLRSATVQFTVLPGQPVTLSLSSNSGPIPEKVAVTNGANLRQRTMLRGVSVQLKDAHGNAAPVPGVQLRFRLQGGSDPAALPKVQMNEGIAQTDTDTRGAAFLGDVCVAEGSGRASSGALECEVVCEALGLYPSSAFAHEMDEDGWAACWCCPVLFTNDAARFAALQQLNQRRDQLVQRRNQVSERLDAAQRAADKAAQRQQKLAERMEQRQRDAPSPLPASVKVAQKKLAQLQRQAEVQAGAGKWVASMQEEAHPPAPAKYGRPQAPATAAIDRVLQSGDAGVVGVVAQLATVEDETLARVAATCCRSVLGVVVVRDAETRKRMVAMLQEQRYPVPDIAVLTHVLAFRGQAVKELPSAASAGPCAQALMRAACAGGSDPPLAAPLPHVSAFARLKAGDAAQLVGQGPGPKDWPPGLCGFLFNLVRPLHRGHRAALLHNLLGNMLVFETLDQASDYREFVVQQKLKTSLPTIVTLDGHRLGSNGIISGSASFQVPPSLEQCDLCFGAPGDAGGGNTAELAAAAAAAMEEWIELIRQRDVAEAAVTEAQAAADSAAAECGRELQEVEGELEQVDAQLALGEMAAGDNRLGQPATTRKRRGRRGGNEGGSVDERSSRRPRR